MLNKSIFLVYTIISQEDKVKAVSHFRYFCTYGEKSELHSKGGG